MPESLNEKILQQHKKTAIETFIGSLMPSAKMMGLYQPGHPNILLIGERVNNILMKTLEQDPTLVVDIKGKMVSAGDLELAETKDAAFLGTTLHTLGIGQILFTNRLSKEGMVEFLKVLLEKPDDKKTLTAIQQEIQKLKIDGLQMSFVLSFVATGETEAMDQTPGQLTEDQITQFVKTGTLEDFLLLLLKQNEPLTGKVSESITMLLDNVLHRGISLEHFQQAMPWNYYDPRIRACWDSFMNRQEWEPKVIRGKSSGWNKNDVISQMGFFRIVDLDVLEKRSLLEKPDAVQDGMKTVHAVIDHPASSIQLEFAMIAYGRLLTDLGHDGNIKALLLELKIWQEPLPSGEVNPQWGRVIKLIEEKVLSPILVGNLVLYLCDQEEKTAQFIEIENFMAALGIKSIPLFIEELRNLADQKNRRKLCGLLGSVCKRLGNVQPLIHALADPDWFVARNVVFILGEISFPGTAQALKNLLRHDHPRVKEEAIRALGKIGDEAAVSILIDFVIKSGRPEEAEIAVTTVSLCVLPGIDSKLIQAFHQVGHYDIRIAIVTALSRVGTRPALDFLRATSKKSLTEMVTGRNKALRAAARESLTQAERALKV